MLRFWSISLALIFGVVTVLLLAALALGSQRSAVVFSYQQVSLATSRNEVILRDLHSRLSLRVTEITEAGRVWHQWSQDGRYVVIHVQQWQGAEIQSRIYDTHTRELREFERDGDYPQLVSTIANAERQRSPDGVYEITPNNAGNTLTVVSTRDFQVCDIDVTNLINSTESLQRGMWSPDNRILAFGVTVGRASGGSAIYLLDAPACELRRLTMPQAHMPGYDWSPDGAHLVYSRDGNIYTIDLLTQTSTPVMDDSAWNSSPHWDSAGIIFASERAGTYDIFMMDDNGDNLRRLTYSQDDIELYPRWQP